MKFSTLFVLAWTVGSTQAFAKDVVVSQKGKMFSMENVDLAVGDTLIFKNDDDTAHNVFSTSDGVRFNFGIQKPGTESKQTFDKAGSAVVRCAIHPKMKLNVNVK